MKKWVWPPVIGALIMVLITSHATGADAVYPQSLTQAIQKALVYHGDVTAQARQAQAFSSRVSVAGVLPDPMIGFGLVNLPVDTFRMDQEGMTQKRVSYKQQFPWPGTLGEKVRAADAAADAARHRSETTELVMAERVAGAYYTLLKFRARSDINLALIQELSRMQRTAEALYASGGGMQQDILAAQVAVSDAMTESLKIEEQIHISELSFKELTGELPDTNIRGLARLPLPVVDPAPWITSVNSHPSLLSKKASINRASANLKLANLSARPGMELTVSYGQRDDAPDGMDRADFVSATMGFKLPVWSTRKNKPEIISARHNLSSAELSYDQAVKTLESRILKQVARIARLQKEIDLIQTVTLPQARLWAESADIAYRDGNTRFQALIKAGIRVILLSQRVSDLTADIYMARATLDTMANHRFWVPDTTQKEAGNE